MNLPSAEYPARLGYFVWLVSSLELVAERLYRLYIASQEHRRQGL
jgi:hypothetical protein